MALVRWEPMRELEQPTNRMNRLFGYGGRWPTEGEMTLADWAPAVDVEETQEEFIVKAELPGLEKEEVKVSCKDGVLTIQGERKQEKEVKDKKYHRIERTYGTFMRSFTLPENVDEKKIMAEQKDGILYVRMPKTAEKKPTAFDVKVQ